MGAKLKQLRDNYAKGLGRADALHKKEDRTAEETAELAKLLARPGNDGKTPEGSLFAFKADIKAEEEAEAQLDEHKQWAKQPARTFPHAAAAKGRLGEGEDDEEQEDRAQIEAGESAADKARRTGGFKSMGHLAYTIARAARGDYESIKSLTCYRVAERWIGDDDPDDNRHRPKGDHVREAAVKALSGQFEEALKAASGMGITADPAADVFVPMEFSSQIFKRTEGIESNLASKVRRSTCRGSMIRYPAWNDANRAAAYRAGGVQAYWEGEGDAANPTKIDQTRWMEFRPKKLMALVYCSEELLTDSVGAIDGYINDAGSEAISFKLNQAIWEGNGASKPQGVTTSNAKVTVAKENAQTAATIVAANIDKMWMRSTSDCRSRMTWHINQDTEQQLAQLYYATGASSGQLLYVPPGGISASPYGSIKGRPVVPLEWCSTLGTEGDIALIDWSQYMLVTKGDTVRDVSMHVKFTTDEQTFRFKFRADGQPMWDAPITPLKGSNTTSCIVTLATRA